MSFGFGFGFTKTAIASAIATFSPSSLFANGEQGVWYDPSDLTTLYQDAAGTTPVTAVEQPVGLMLDKSKGLVLGPQLTTNGDFSNGFTGYAEDGAGTRTIESGEAKLTITGAAYTNIAPGISGLTAGRSYQVAWNMRAVTAGGAVSDKARLQLVGATSIITAAVPGKTQYSLIFTAGGTTLQIYIGVASAAAWGAIGDSAFFDNISVRELPGNHAFQTVSTKRPVLSARVNLLTKTEQFDGTVWVKQAGTSVSATKVAAPDGTLTALSVTGDGVSGLYQIVPGTNGLGQSTRSIYLRVQAGTATVVIKDPALTQGTTTCNLTTLWKRFTLSETTSPTGGNTAGIWVSNIPVTGIEVAWPDLRPTNIGVNLPAYQRVNTATDYDTQGFPTYLKFDGIDDSMQTNSIDFTATDKITVFAGVRKLSDANQAIAVETGTGSGSFTLAAPRNAVPNYAWTSRGVSSNVEATAPSSYPAPIANVLTGIGNISGDQAILRVNGIQAAVSNADQGTGNYGNYPLYIGARAGTSLFFNGHLYSLIVRGAQSTDAQITASEAYTAKKTGLYGDVDYISTDENDFIVTDDGDFLVLGNTYI